MSFNEVKASQGLVHKQIGASQKMSCRQKKLKFNLISLASSISDVCVNNKQMTADT